MLALPASSFATLTEVGAIPQTTPPTAPSCTAGPLGAAGREAEEQAKKEREQAKKEQEEKKKAKKKKRTGHKSSTHRSRRRAHKASVQARHTLRRHARSRLIFRDGGIEAFGPLLGDAHVASTTTPSTEAAQTTEGTEEAAEGEGTEEAAEGTESAVEAPCLAVSRTTGFQARVGSIRHPLVIPHNGRIVAWTIHLGRPTPAQIKFFDENEGGPASAGLAILFPKKKPKQTYHLLAQTQILKLERYFGMTVQFPLSKTIKVKKGDVVALTVPTWAPALALGFKKATSWRASRQKSQCSTTNSQTAQTELKSNVQYYCLYLTARLTYSATLISTP